jgi:hypothetical protein
MMLIGLITAIMALEFGLWAAVVVYTGLGAVVVGTLVILDRPAALLFAVSALTLGPLCGPVLLLITSPLRWTAQPTPEPALCAPTPAERIAQDIAQGRRPLMRERGVSPFIEVFSSGDLRDQQSALAAIARYFAPELRPALNRAQNSDIPAIRVQSTAVLTQLRDIYARRARRVLAQKTGLSASALAAEIQMISKSGFIDPQTLTELGRAAHCTDGPRNMGQT